MVPIKSKLSLLPHSVFFDDVNTMRSTYVLEVKSWTNLDSVISLEWMRSVSTRSKSFSLTHLRKTFSNAICVWAGSAIGKWPSRLIFAFLANFDSSFQILLKSWNYLHAKYQTTRAILQQFIFREMWKNFIAFITQEYFKNLERPTSCAKQLEIFTARESKDSVLWREDSDAWTDTDGKESSEVPMYNERLVSCILKNNFFKYSKKL